ncbi:MAG: hypothetical protein V9E83_04560 [Baekduia sp.]
MVAAAGSFAAATTAHGATPPRVGVAVTTCTTGSAPEYRSAIFTATVSRGPRAKRMAARFRLLRTSRLAVDTGDPAPVAAKVALPAWNAWARSKRGRSALVVSRRVDGLSGPAAYAVDVETRWYDAKGRVIARRTTRSVACDQPDYAPDIEASVTPRAGGLDVSVYNRGRSVSAAGMVSVLSGGVQIGRAEVAPLAPGARMTVAVSIESCPAAPLVVTVKTGDARELSYGNNEVRDVPCPG